MKRNWPDWSFKWTLILQNLDPNRLNSVPTTCQDLLKTRLTPPSTITSPSGFISGYGRWGWWTGDPRSLLSINSGFHWKVLAGWMFVRLFDWLPLRLLQKKLPKVWKQRSNPVRLLQKQRPRPMQERKNGAPRKTMKSLQTQFLPSGSKGNSPK